MASRIFFLISALCIFSVSADVFVSIDCGSSDFYTDENLIVWTGDDDYIQNGESYAVQSSNSVSPVMDTLRAFATRSKNCYSVEASKGERVLVRATFYYGNYDGKSSPPTFDLLIDGNAWATVETSSTDYVYYEMIYVLKGDYVSVCVAQSKPDQIPFMSALEVRSLLPTMYDRLDQNYPLYLIGRVAYGANATIRYVDDPYDRIWMAAAAGDGLTAVTSDALMINSGVRDEPPPAVLQHAVSAVSPTARIKLSLGVPPSASGEIAIYLNMYFSEVAELDATQRRSFLVVIDGQPLLDDPVIPPYANSTELYASNFTVSSNTTLTLVPTADSTLPPLINAMEVYQIGDALSDGTHSEDVDGLASLQSDFAELQDGSGDPCLPELYSWDWINCSSDHPTPRVTALYLGSFGLEGALPDFSAMDALETIDFQNNSLDGPIPEFLAALPNLKQLNLASNRFSGPIPDSLSKKNGLNVTGNPDLCTSGNSCKTTITSPTNTPGLRSPPKKKKSKLPLILGTTIIPIFIIVWGVVGAIVVLHHRRKATASTSGANRPQSSPLKPPMFGKMGETIMNEIKINLEDQSGSVDDDQTNHDQQQDGTTTN